MCLPKKEKKAQFKCLQLICCSLLDDWTSDLCNLSNDLTTVTWDLLETNEQ